MGGTTIVCGVKAEIAEPELDSPDLGFIGESSSCFYSRSRYLLRDIYSQLAKLNQNLTFFTRALGDV
jgi:hypothetical protein